MRAFVVGCGSIGRRHVGNLCRLGLKDVVVFDTDRKVAREVAAKYGVEAVETFEAGVARSPDFALVCVPHRYHISAATVLASAAIHVFIEKPLDVTLDGVQGLLDLVDRNDLITMVACNYRFDPGLSMVKDFLDRRLIGEILSLRASFGFYLPNWRPGTDYRSNYAAKKSTGGGVMLDRIHEFDYVIWLMGDVERIEGYAGRIGKLDIETEDNAEIVLKHVNGTVSNIHLDYLRREYSCTCEILGSDGIIQWDFSNRIVRLYQSSKQSWVDYSGQIPADTNVMYVEELRQFINCVEKRAPASNPIRESVQTLKVVLAAKRKLLGEQ